MLVSSLIYTSTVRPSIVSAPQSAHDNLIPSSYHSLVVLFPGVAQPLNVASAKRKCTCAAVKILLYVPWVLVEFLKYVLTFEAIGANNPDIETITSISEFDSTDEYDETETLENEIASGSSFSAATVIRTLLWIVLSAGLLGGAGFGAYLLSKKMLGKNIIVYQVYSDGSYNLLTKMKLTEKEDSLDMNLLPEKTRDKITENNFIFELTNSARTKFEGKHIIVKLRNKTHREYIDPNFEMKKYQFEVDFSKV